MKYIVILCLLSTLTIATPAAEAARMRNAKDAFMELSSSIKAEALTNSLSVGTPRGLVEERTIQEAGSTHRRYQQKFKNFPIWGHRILVKQASSGEIKDLSGTFVDQLEGDAIPDNAKLSSQEAYNLALNDFVRSRPNSVEAKKLKVRKDLLNLQILVKDGEPARLVYVVQFFVGNDKTNGPSRPLYLIDATNGKILKTMQTLVHVGESEAQGPGGNKKTGQYEYGKDFPGFFVHASEDGKKSIIETENVKVVDCNSTFDCSELPFSFDGNRNTYKAINGAFSPINDAAFFGRVTFQMYKDWYDLNPLNRQLILQIHYGDSFENAQWDGQRMSFGDGANDFYPLVSLDVMAHEASHGFTEFNSGLLYESESGGINEAFSDIAGEAAEFFAKGTNDFLVGHSIFKGEGALRYMDHPTRDGNSIDHVKKYKEGMDVHYSSGIYNKAFYLIATSKGWNTRKAFDLFVRANRMYWQPSTTFKSGAEGVLKAATDLSYDTSAVKKAFNQVGIKL